MLLSLIQQRMTYSYAFAFAIASYQALMSAKRGESSRGYRSQGRRIAEESSPSTGAKFHVLDPSGGPLSLESPTPQHQHHQQQFFTEFQPSSFPELPVDLQGGLQLSHLETDYSTAISEQQQQQQQSLPQTTLYEGSHQLQDPLLPLESVPSESSPAGDPTDIARQSQVLSAEHSRCVCVCVPSTDFNEPCLTSKYRAAPSIFSLHPIQEEKHIFQSQCMPACRVRSPRSRCALPEG